MDDTLPREGEALGDCVEALASAHRRVLKIQNDIRWHCDLRLRLLQTGQTKAAEATKLRIRNLEVARGRLEGMSIVASYRVRHLFEAATAHEAPFARGHGALTRHDAFQFFGVSDGQNRLPGLRDDLQNAGREFILDGVPVTRNPWLMGTEEHKAWCDGWIDESERRHTTSQERDCLRRS